MKMNKTEELTRRLGEELPPLTNAQKMWADCEFGNYAFGIGWKKWCTSCGGHIDVSKVMPDTDDTLICPHCCKRVGVVHTGKRRDRAVDYFSILSIHKGWQVVRNFCISKDIVKGCQNEPVFYEVSRVWITPESHKPIMWERPMRYMYFYASIPYAVHKQMILRKSSMKMAREFIQYPRCRVLAPYRKYGITTEFHGLPFWFVLTTVPFYDKAETLYKAGYYSLLGKAVYDASPVIDKNWDSIRICLRNHYTPEDTELWLDHLDNLRYCGLDLRNSKYVCPGDLRTAHDELAARVRRFRDRKCHADDLQRQRAYDNRMRAYAELKVTDDDAHIECFPLLSVKEMKHEGDVMHNCVFKNAYYERNDSLIMTSYICGKKACTIEIDLNAMKVRQCYGDHNSSPAYADKICGVLQRNLGKIRQCREMEIAAMA